MAGENNVVYQTSLDGARLFKRGKVRDVYDAGDCLVLVATDRLSAFDVVFADPIPLKGKVLNQISAFWFEKTKRLVPNHLQSTQVRDFPEEFHPYSGILAGRSALVRKSTPFKIECVVRGYLSGSGWADYKKTGSVCGVKLRAGLEESDKLDEPIFTPATKEETGHDINIDSAAAAKIVGGAETYEKIRNYSLRLYEFASNFAILRGIIIADTKFEFGLINGEVTLIDEALTPDSSRFWSAEDYAPGKSQQSYDKQYLRDYVTSLGWDRKPPAPALPKEVIGKTTEKYVEAFETLTGKKLEYA